MQTGARGPAYLPGTQSVHIDVWPGAAVPATHQTQPVEELDSSLRDPGAHPSQNEAPVKSEKCPGWQCVQADNPAPIATVPGEQEAQLVDASLELTCPGGHSRQVSGKALTSLEALLLAVNWLKAWATPNEAAAPAVKEYVPGWQL